MIQKCGRTISVAPTLLPSRLNKFINCVKEKMENYLNIELLAFILVLVVAACRCSLLLLLLLLNLLFHRCFHRFSFGTATTGSPFPTIWTCPHLLATSTDDAGCIWCILRNGRNSSPHVFLDGTNMEFEPQNLIHDHYVLIQFASILAPRNQRLVHHVHVLVQRVWPRRSWYNATG